MLMQKDKINICRSKLLYTWKIGIDRITVTKQFRDAGHY